MRALWVRVIPFLFVFIWSTGFIAAKYAAPVAGPFSLLALRMGAVVVILGLAALLLRRRWPSPRLFLNAMVAGILAHAVYLGGVFYVERHGLPAGLMSLIVGLQPILTAFMAAPILHEKITLRHAAGLVAGFVGVSLVLGPHFDMASLSGISPLNVALGVGSVASMALSTVWQKRFVVNTDLLTGAVAQYVGAALVLIPAAYFEGFDLVPGLQLTLVVVWLVLALSIGGILLLLVMINAGRVSEVAALFYLVPAVGGILSYFLFGETLQPVQILGTVLVVVAVAVVMRKPKAVAA